MSYAAEKNVIGSLFLDARNMDPIYGMLAPDMFQDELLGSMYREFQRGYDNGYPVTPAVMVQKLSGSNIPEQVIVETIKDCVVDTVTGAAIRGDARVIVNDFKAYRLGIILNSVKASPGRVEEQIGMLMADLEALKDSKDTPSKTLSRIAHENKGNYFTDNTAAGIYLGFPKLDNLLGSLEGGDMIVIGARPAVGKSAFVTQVASNLGKQGKRVGFYNLEMQEKQVYERFVVSCSGIGLTRLRRAKQFLGDEKERFDAANTVLEKQDNIVITTGVKSISEIRNESRHMGYDVIIIDYLQLLKTDKEYMGNRTAEVGAISRSVKAIAMDLNIPVIVLSQLNRSSEARENKEPTMAELREAGDIEQDASVVLLMWNLSEKDRSQKGCKVEKQRQGEIGKTALSFDGNLMQFKETEEKAEETGKWEKAPENECPFG